MHKNIIVRQRDLKDCGSCCLLSIIKYYGGYIPLEKILLDTKTNKTGTTAFHIINAAQKYGFDAMGLKVESEKLPDLLFPVIAHMQLASGYQHFVVIYEYDPNKQVLKIMDPASGLVKISLDEFLKSWTKVVIKMYPNSKLPLLTQNNKIFHLFKTILVSEKELISKLIFTSIIFTIISIMISFYLKAALYEVNNGNMRGLRIIIALFIFLAIMKVILNYLKEYYENYLNKNIDLKVMLPFLKHLFFLPLNVVGSRSPGEIIKRVEEVNSLKDLFSKILVTIFLDLLLAISAAIILARINKKLFFLLLIICFIYLLSGLLYSPLIYQKIVQNIECETDFTGEVIEKVDSFLTMKNIHRFDWFLRQIEYKYVKFLKDSFNLNKTLIGNNFAKNFINEVGLCLVTSLGCIYILKTGFSLVLLVTFNSLLIYMLNPLKNIIDLLPKINYLKASFNKINEFVALEEEKLNYVKEKFINGDIKFKNLSYSYNDYNYVCKNMNLQIKEKEKVMFKGKSGCGKSTICKLLYRLYEIKEGDIFIGKINILDYSLNTLRSNITYLAQKEVLFQDTIYNNIVLDRQISLPLFTKIASICHLEDIVATKPLRYETIINNNVSNLSGGERQRILLARALLKRSSILILDEALSEVQTDLEKIIIQDICTFFKDKTIIYVTHRNYEDLFDRVIDFEEENHDSLRSE